MKINCQYIKTTWKMRTIIISEYRWKLLTLPPVKDGLLVAMGVGKQEIVEDLCVEKKKWVSGENNGLDTAREKASKAEIWWSGKHHDLCLAHLLLGLLQLFRLALPFCLSDNLQHLLPTAHGSKLARFLGLPGLKNLMPSVQIILQLAPLLALPSHFSAISAGLRKQESQLVSLEKWLVLLCLLPSFLSLLLLLPFFVLPVSPGPQALIFGQPLYLIWAGLDLVTTVLGSSQLVVSKKLVKSWQENEKKRK